MEKPEVPRTVPKEERAHYADALLAHNSGRTLAGLFFLRTTIEQYMRRVTKTITRRTGDELWAAYQELLSEDVPSKDRSLGRIYAELSEKLHDANADEVQFRKSCAEIDRHFEVLRLYPLTG